MFYVGMTQARNIPIKNLSEGTHTGMGSKKINKASDFSQGEQGKNNSKEQQKKDTMEHLVNAETLEGIDHIMSRLKEQEEQLQRSEMEQQKKQISLEEIYLLQGEYNLKKEKIIKENKLREDILHAEQSGDYQLVLELKKEYQREKSVRKSNEYTVLQRALVKEDTVKGQGVLAAYQDSVQDFSAYQDGQKKGTYINLTSG